MYQPRLLCLLFQLNKKSTSFSPILRLSLVLPFPFTLSHVNLSPSVGWVLIYCCLGAMPPCWTPKSTPPPFTDRQKNKQRLRWFDVISLIPLVGTLGMMGMNPVAGEMNPCSHFKLLSPVWSLWNELSSGSSSTTLTPNASQTHSSFQRSRSAIRSLLVLTSSLLRPLFTAFWKAWQFYWCWFSEQSACGLMDDAVHLFVN